MVTETSIAFVIVFYISFITNPFITKNKRQLDAIACNVTIRFFGFTPTMDIEPFLFTLRLPFKLLSKNLKGLSQTIEFATAPVYLFCAVNLHFRVKKLYFA